MQKEYDFTVIFQPMTEGGYMVIVPSLPGLVTSGRTLDEAKKMASDAIQCHCEGLLKDGEEIPSDDERASGVVMEHMQVGINAS